MTEELKVAVDRRPNGAILYTKGYINNVGGEEIANRAYELMDQGMKTLLLNLRETKIVNSIGISILIESIAAYLRDARGAGLRLAAKSQSCAAPDVLDDERALAGHVVIPIRTSKDHFGAVALSGQPASHEELQMLETAGEYLGTLLNSQ